MTALLSALAAIMAAGMWLTAGVAITRRRLPAIWEHYRGIYPSRWVRHEMRLAALSWVCFGPARVAGEAVARWWFALLDGFIDRGDPKRDLREVREHRR